MASQPQAKYWAYEDLFSLPDDGKRYEIIAGELYEMPAPKAAHAAIIMNLIVRLFGPLIDTLGVRVFTAPIDVFMHNASPVQPDLLVLLADQLDRISERGIEGPPALIVEVLSPGNSRHDLVLKRTIYERAGVREYWIISPEAMIVEILTLDGEHYRTHARVAGAEQLSSVALPAIVSPASSIFEQ